MPELPDERVKRLISTYNLPRYDASVIVRGKAIADFFEECVKLHNRPKEISNWIMSDLIRRLNDYDLELSEAKITPKLLVEMIRLIDEGVISGKIAKRILPEIVKTGRTPNQIVEEQGLTKITSRESLEKIVEQIFAENQKAVADALKDEKNVHFLIGKLMKATNGQADPQLTHQIIREKLMTLKN
jgi:aspartyl-tRNA(Asn)/glutamyl-tRNA(Gln) amidotransferase subunit B